MASDYCFSSSSSSSDSIFRFVFLIHYSRSLFFARTQFELICKTKTTVNIWTFMTYAFSLFLSSSSIWLLINWFFCRQTREIPEDRKLRGKMIIYRSRFDWIARTAEKWTTFWTFFYLLLPTFILIKREISRIKILGISICLTWILKTNEMNVFLVSFSNSSSSRTANS